MFAITALKVLMMIAYGVPGYLLVKTKALGEDSIKAFAKFLLYVCQPALSLYTLTSVDSTPILIRDLWIFFFVTLLAQIAVIFLYSLIFSKKMKSDLGHRVCSVAGICGNVGFFGVPLLEYLIPGMPEVRVTGNRPDQWARSGESFDLLLVDAPCSGQSLLCKGIKNPGCLSSSMVNGNAKRQKGIMLSAVQCVNPGGHIVYTTCTYDPEENEKVMAYILKRVPGWSAVEVPVLEPFRSSLADFPAYRLLPGHGFGAGGFCCLLRKEN